MPLAERLRHAREVDATHEAIVAGSRRWTYGELDDVTDRLAESLARLGIQQGDRVALQLGNCPELVMAYYACFKLGAISVPLNNRLASPEIEYTLNHAACRVCISQPDLYERVDTIRPALKSVEHFFLIDGASAGKGLLSTSSFDSLIARPAEGVTFPPPLEDAVAAILYTSGTTSRPKGVTHTHKSIAAMAEIHGTQIGMGPDDVICVVPPMCHILGFATQMVAGIWGRARLVILPKFDPELVLQAIHEHKATRIAGLPVMFQAMVNHPQAAQYSLHSLRTCFGGGDAVPAALQEKFLSTFGVQILEGCGMTEVIPFTANMPSQLRIGSIGRACPGMTIRLVDDAGQDVPAGTTGEILVRTDAAMIGYWQEPEISKATMEGGFIHSGDLARIDDDGYYWFVGRKKEIIIRAGSNISPLEVEEALYQHPAVRECGVIGVPDATVGEIVCAFVATTSLDVVDSAELQEFLKGKIAPYKVPEVIRFMPTLPKGPTGKIHRRTLREQLVQERRDFALPPNPGSA